MRQRRAGAVAAGEVRLVHMHGMAEDRARACQPGVVIHIEIARPIGKQLANPLDLALILAEMRLDIGSWMLPPEAAGGLQLRLGRGGGEARGDAIELAALLMPPGDQRLRLRIARLGRIEQALRRVAIHKHLAGDHPRVEALRFLEQRVDRLRVNGAVDRSRRRSGAQKLAQEAAGHIVGMIGIGEVLLGDEGVFVEPFQQAGAKRADHLHLGIVHVSVDEAGADQRVGIMRDRHVCRQCLEPRLGILDAQKLAILDDDQRVRPIVQGVAGREDERVAAKCHGGGADCPLRHGGFLSGSSFEPRLRRWTGRSRIQIALADKDRPRSNTRPGNTRGDDGSPRDMMKASLADAAVLASFPSVAGGFVDSAARSR